MSITALAPILLNLDRGDKLRAMQILIQELAKEEDDLLSDNSFAICSPDAPFEAANALLKALNTEPSLETIDLLELQGPSSPVQKSSKPG